MATIDSTPFYGVRAPADIRATAKLLASGKVEQKTQFRKILEPVLVYAEKREAAVDEGLLADDSMTLLAQQIGLEFDVCVTLFTGLYSIVKKVIRHNVELDKVKADLLELRFPDAFVVDLCAVIKKSRAALVAAAEQRCASLQSLVDVAWRTDVAIASDGMARVLQPSVLMSILTSDNTKRTFACSPEAIEQLRFGVASMLSDMTQLESLQILKVKK